MKALFDSLIRTYVPWLVGVLVGWLVSLGIPLDPDVEPQITAALMLVSSMLWYFLARVFETYVHPKLGWLIGLPKQPLYDGKSRDQILADFARLDLDEQTADLQAARARVEG